MRRRAAAAYVVLAAVLFVATVGPSSPGAHPEPDPRNLDLLASAQPTAAQTVVIDVAFDELKTRAHDVKADAMATTSAACDGCGGESATLQVLYLSRASLARLDNSAVAWTQACQGCTGTALSVQVVVLQGRPEVRPNNRAMALTAACTGCRTSAAAFQVVVVADGARRLSDESLAGLRAWFDEQAAVLRSSIAVPSPEPSPTADPTSPTTAPTTGPTETTGPTDETSLPPDPTDPSARWRVRRSARRASTFALAELEGLVVADLGADAIVSDVDLGR